MTATTPLVRPHANDRLVVVTGMVRRIFFGIRFMILLKGFTYDSNDTAVVCANTHSRARSHVQADINLTTKRVNFN